MALRMSGSVKLALVLVAGLGLLTVGAAIFVQKTTRAWFEKDVALRSELALTRAHGALVTSWRVGDRTALRTILEDMTRGERLFAAALCGASRELVAATRGFPAQIDCRTLAGQVPGNGRGRAVVTEAGVELPTGGVHLGILPVVDGDRPLGVAVLVHDMGYVAGRQAETRWFLIVAFAVLAAAASALTLLAARVSWRRFTAELWRRLVPHGDGPPPDFSPLARDMRDLVERIRNDKDSATMRGAWGPERLRDVLVRQLQGQRVIILANREPYIHERAPDGAVSVVHPASGLVTALEPVMRVCSGVWVAHGSGSADRETVDRQGHVRVPPGEESYVLRRVWLTPEEEKGYYYGFSNEGLWPLCHIAHQRPVFRSEDFHHYREVNRRFAEAVVAEADSEEPIILVQDYHFALVPRFIRERLPHAVILTFWHVPWPNSERFGICPFRQAVLEGLLGSSIVGFHTQAHCNNFLEAVDRYMEARIDRESNAVVQRGRRTLVRSYPISIEWPSRWAAQAPPPAECRASLITELGLRADALIGVGVDRLDYTKGIEERFLAVERLLEKYPAYRGRFTFVQLAAPSRTVIEAYQRLNENVQRTADRINEKFGREGYRPIVLHRAHHEPPTVYRFYRAADVCYVSSLHDGMNLVAKEFVSARDDERGVLVLSQFTGAARELAEALLVNPYDIDVAATALATALTMSPDEQRARMQAMRSFLSEFNVYRWAGRMLIDAETLRRRERFSDQYATLSAEAHATS